jgi:hypothetical protein
MGPIYKYAVLEAIPDPRKGERVNVGVAAFSPTGLEIRFGSVGAKLRALTGRSWSPDFDAAKANLLSIFDAQKAPEEWRESALQWSAWLKPSALGSLRAASPEEFFERIDHIIKTLVDVPPPTAKRPKTTRIKTEITRALQENALLADRGESITSGRVVKDYLVAPEEDLWADFAAKNGAMLVVSALDLRKQNTPRGEAALKSITLDTADRIYNGAAKTVGIYAVDPTALPEYRPHLAMLHEYAKTAFVDWGDAVQRRQFLSLLATTLHGTPPLAPAH